MARTGCRVEVRPRLRKKKKRSCHSGVIDSTLWWPLVGVCIVQMAVSQLLDPPQQPGCFFPGVVTYLPLLPDNLGFATTVAGRTTRRREEQDLGGRGRR